MADRERAAFELMLVHNLKAPLIGIVALLEMLHDGDLGDLTDTQRSAVREMQAHGAEMVKMIDELVDLRHARSSLFAVNRTPIDAATFLREMQSGWVGRLGRLTTSVEPGVPDLEADASILRRVLDNLLMNARVHAGQDTTVTLHAQRAGDAVHLTVADDGPGIPAPDAERVFEPFVTLSRQAESRNHGLGLAYCRAALAAMDGQITLKPTPRGATFVVALPAAIPVTRQAAEQPR
jgi:two-component system sensor histidine kinase KdpD